MPGGIVALDAPAAGISCNLRCGTRVITFRPVQNQGDRRIASWKNGGPVRIIVAGAVLLSRASAAQADIVTDWMAYGLKVEGDTNRTQDNAPANSQLGAAMFEAANAIDR